MPDVTLATPSPRRPALSWPDALIAAVDKVPGPPGVAYLAVGLVVALAVHVAEWLSGALPYGHFTFSITVGAVWSVLALASFDYLNRAALTAAQRFRPVTDLTDQQFDLLVYQLTHIPALAAWLCIPVTLVWMWAMRLADPSLFGFLSGHIVTSNLFLVLGLLNAALMVVGSYRGISVLAAVARSQSSIVRLNLFDTRPLFAFSGFTARIALVVAAMTYLFFLAFPTVIRNPFSFSYIVLIGLPITLGSFVLPVYRTHTLMVAEKERLETGVRQRIQVALDALHDEMDAAAAPEGTSAHRTVTKDFLGSLMMEENYIRQAPTWPWEPSTFRTLLAALLLPMVIFVLQQLLLRLLGL